MLYRPQYGLTDVNLANKNIAYLKPVSDPLLRAINTLDKAIIIGNFPPRQCGLATFTRDMYAALCNAQPQAQFDVVAMNDGVAAYDYPVCVRYEVLQTDRKAYSALGDQLREAHYQAAFVQHEFGIYGGPSGCYILECLRRLTCPIITTLHTILECPNSDQREVMEGLIGISSQLITMTKKGSDILQSIYKVPLDSIKIIPHGAPTRPLKPTDEFKAKLGIGNHQTITSFGLLSPNKGLETVINALPMIKAVCPTVKYLIVGATHPNLMRNEGERYRESLKALAQRLDVEGCIIFMNAFIDDEALISILQASDVYVTPYLTESQITSGTLTYALALGRPVGILCPFKDVDAFAIALISLLSNDNRRHAMSVKAYEANITTQWPRVGAAYINLTQKALERPSGLGATLKAVTAFNRPRIVTKIVYTNDLRALYRMSDDTGLMQHGKYLIGDRSHGYCTDDNARALLLMAYRSRLAPLNNQDLTLAYIYAGFVNHAWNPDTNRFRNFMSFGRNWLDEGGSDDCCARTLDALVEVNQSALPEDLKLWARELIDQIIPISATWQSVRAHTLMCKVLGKCLRQRPTDKLLSEALYHHAKVLVTQYEDHAGPEHSWFEPELSYDNARLPEGLLWAAEALGHTDWMEIAFKSLDWLDHRQRAGAFFRPIPTYGFCLDHAGHSDFDQQPIEALATVEAGLKAHSLQSDKAWLDMSDKAMAWFDGANDHGLSLISKDGGCYDGLTPQGVNRNQGAESILSYHLSHAIRAG
jgi:glycosyltransferase involved in cell wall biosynthesis